VSVTLAGNFSANLETEFLFVMEPQDWPALVEFDTTLAGLLNDFLVKRFGRDVTQKWGQIVNYNINNRPVVYDNITLASFSTDFYELTMDPSAQMTYLSQAFAYAQATVETNPNSFELLYYAAIPNLLHWKVNMKNLNGQFEFIGY